MNEIEIDDHNKEVGRIEGRTLADELIKRFPEHCSLNFGVDSFLRGLTVGLRARFNEYVAECAVQND